MNMALKRILFLLAILTVLFSCTDNDSDHPGKNYVGLEVSTDFIKLMDDSTAIAGNLDISANASQVYLRWNVPTGCNLDTTLSVIRMSKGKATLPIKWSKVLDGGNRGPANMAYEGGVVISTEKESKYIRLFWVEELDTAAILANPVLMTRADGDLPKAIEINLLPDANVVMNQQTGGAVTVDFTGVLSVRVDASDVSNDTHVDLTDVPLVMHEPGDVFFPWTAEGAPNFSFVKTVRFQATSYIYKDAILNYRIPGTPVYYDFVKSIPDAGGELSAQNATVTVVVYTNKEWSLESEFNAFPPTEDPNAFGPEDKTLVMHITDNEDSQPREVTVYVKSQGVNKDTLTFMQLGASSQSDVFEFIKSVPADGATIPAAGSGIEVTVKTDQNWHISSNVSTTVNYEVAGEAVIVTKTYNVPANTSNEDRTVRLTIGTDNAATEKTVEFIQSGSGTTPENPLRFASVLLPDKLPATESTYTFNFVGDYTGSLRIRSKSGGQVLYTENLFEYPGTQPIGRVPANIGAEREISFEYDKNDGNWISLPTATNRMQEGNGGETGSVKAGPLTPDRDLSEYGEECSCEFTGDFTGTIILRARVGNEELARNTGASNSVIVVKIPCLSGLNRVITFDYSIDGGDSWNGLGNRTQVNEYIGFIDLQPSGKNMPAAGQTYTWGIEGSYSKNVTFQVCLNSTDDGNQIYEESAAPSHVFSVKIPENQTKQARTVIFRYKLEDDTKWTIIDVKYQAANK